MHNNKEQNDVTKISKKEIQKLHAEKTMKAEKEDEAILNAHKEELTPRNQLR